MTQSRRSLALVFGPLFGLCLGLSVAGCSTERQVPVDHGSLSEADRPIEVITRTHVLRVRYAGDDLVPVPSPTRGETFDALLDSGDVGPGDHVSIERGSGLLADSRARALATRMRREGLRVDLAHVERAPDDELRVVVTHVAAVAPGCPDWSDATGDNSHNTMPRNFGCAAAGDLAAMVADPRDLVRGRRLAPVVGDPALYAMRRYRMGAPETPTATSPVFLVAPTTSTATALHSDDAPPPAASAPSGAAPANPVNPAAPAGPAAAAAALGVTPARPS